MTYDQVRAQYLAAQERSIMLGGEARRDEYNGIAHHLARVAAAEIAKLRHDLAVAKGEVTLYE